MKIGKIAEIERRKENIERKKKKNEKKRKS